MHHELLLKPFHPSLEDSNTVAAELLQTAHCLFWSLLSIEVRLRVELVGIADYLFFNAFGRKILMRERQVLSFYFCSSKASSRMSLCNTGMTRQSFATKYFCPQKAVTDVGLCTITEDGRSINSSNADVMQHCRFPEERLVGSQFRVLPCYKQGSSSYVSAMAQQHLLQCLVTFAILMNQVIYHNLAQSYEEIKKEERRIKNYFISLQPFWGDKVILNS